jgi:hypothetical protein
MKTETLVGVGIGLLVGWLLWRRRGLMSPLYATAGGCGGCAGSLSAGTAAGAAPGACAQRFSAGTGVQHYAQQSGPSGQGWGNI